MNVYLDFFYELYLFSFNYLEYKYLYRKQPFYKSSIIYWL